MILPCPPSQSFYRNTGVLYNRRLWWAYWPASSLWVPISLRQICSWFLHKSNGTLFPGAFSQTCTVSDQGSSETLGCRWPALVRFLPGSLWQYLSATRLSGGSKPWKYFGAQCQLTIFWSLGLLLPLGCDIVGIKTCPYEEVKPQCQLHQISIWLNPDCLTQYLVTAVCFPNHCAPILSLGNRTLLSL